MQIWMRPCWGRWRLNIVMQGKPTFVLIACPLINKAAIAKIEAHIADVLQKRASLLLDGQRHALGQIFFEPTVLAGVDSSILVAKEEIFDPLAPLFRFHSDAEVIAMTNDSEFGLVSYFYSRDIGSVWCVAEALEVAWWKLSPA
jgi:succinate-semialdehyde dehydrogenase / glutarate-semialdehyde dehydrogenase